MKISSTSRRKVYEERASSPLPYSRKGCIVLGNRGKAKDTGTRKKVSACTRCILLDLNCDRDRAKCNQCESAGLDCVYLRITECDRLLGSIPEDPRNGNIPAVRPMHYTNDGWEKTTAGQEFIKEPEDGQNGPEDTDNIKDNPLCLQPGAYRLSWTFTNMLHDAIQKYPEEESEDVADEFKLPSSEMLETISRCLGEREAKKMEETPDGYKTIEEKFGASGLLALGK